MNANSAHPEWSSRESLEKGATTICGRAPDDVVIVGGGASGVAVTVQLIERIKRGKQVKSITMIEKSNVVGPGFAYSKACVGTILNMQADTMGFHIDNPRHFYQWMKLRFPDLEETNYPPRRQYGEYLSWLMKNAAQEAEQLGVVLRVRNAEVIDICHITLGVEVSLADGTKLQAHNLVLAVGNFPAQTHPQLAGTPGYFESPWPVARLKTIPAEASVSIFGSRLSAIDAAIALAQRGHRGPITMVSRSGRLPKVQGANPIYPRRYMLHSLTRDVEQSPENAFAKIMLGLQGEIERTTSVDWTKIARRADPLTELRSDIDNAKNGRVPWLAVLKVTESLFERYWKCFSTEEKNAFIQTYGSIWAIYRHAIPQDNACKLLALMEKGQLRVIRGDKARWNGSAFAISGGDTEMESQFMIEAIGQQFNPHRVNSPLLKRLISTGFLKPHPFGGFQVDFPTMKAEENVYVLGAMTKGVHFHTTSIERNIAHAVRVADGLVGDPVVRPLHVALFGGNDSPSHFMLSKIIPLLLQQGHIPFVFLPIEKIRRNSSEFHTRELCFQRTQLPQQHDTQFFGSSAPRGVAGLTIEQLGSHYGILVSSVPNVNDPAFIKLLESHHIDAGISFCGSAPFQKPIMQYFSSPRVLLNLHPSVLPLSSGTMTTSSALENKKLEYGYTMHYIAENAKPRIVLNSVRTFPTGYQRSALYSIEDVCNVGVAMVSNSLDYVARGKRLPVLQLTQEALAKSHNYPTLASGTFAKASMHRPSAYRCKSYTAPACKVL